MQEAERANFRGPAKCDFVVSPRRRRNIGEKKIEILLKVAFSASIMQEADPMSFFLNCCAQKISCLRSNVASINLETPQHSKTRGPMMVLQPQMRASLQQIEKVSKVRYI